MLTYVNIYKIKPFIQPRFCTQFMSFASGVNKYLNLHYIFNFVNVSMCQASKKH